MRSGELITFHGYCTPRRNTNTTGKRRSRSGGTAAFEGPSLNKHRDVSFAKPKPFGSILQFCKDSVLLNECIVDMILFAGILSQRSISAGARDLPCWSMIWSSMALWWTSGLSEGPGRGKGPRRSSWDSPMRSTGQQQAWERSTFMATTCTCYCQCYRLQLMSPNGSSFYRTPLQRSQVQGNIQH